MATKKISELPLVNAVSGSQIAGGSVLPIVIGTGIQGTTNQISAENFSKFVNAYNATTGSNTFIGNQNVTGNVTISGRLTVNEVVAQYETASILFSTGSTKLGDQLTDKHEFTGSTNITGSFIYNGVLVANIDSNTIYRLQQATQSLQVASASLQAHSASVDAQLARVFQTTASIQQATASIQAYTASADSRFLLLQQTTQSLQVATASLNAFTASQDGRNFVISQFTSSTDAHIVGISDFTSSQLAVNLGNAIYTSSVDNHIVGVSIYTSSVDNHIVGISAFTSSQLNVNLGNAIYTASVDSHIVGISTYTSSVRDTLARVHQSTASIQQATSSLQSFTASQDSRNFTLSQVTGSLIGVTNGLMAFTAALDNTYATDAQLYQLYQATRSIELHSGSMIGVTNGLMAYTASNTNLNAGLRGEVDGIEAYTASLKGQAIVSSSTQVQNYDLFALNSNLYTSTGSLIGITNGLMAFTAALDSTYATDEQLTQLYQATRSIELTTGSLIGITNGLMEFTAALDSTYATDAQLYQLYAETASIKAEIGGIEAYTASLKGAAIVSSSTQIQNYDLFALNSNLYNSTGSIKGEIAGIEAYTASLKGAIEVSGQDVNVLGMITAQQFNVTLVSSSVLYQSGSTKFGNSNDDKHEFTGSVNIGNTSHAYLNIDAGNSSANESGIYHKIGGLNKWEQYTAANDNNLNWYSQGNGIQFKIYPTQGASFTGPITASAAKFDNVIRTTPNNVANYFADYAYNGVTYNFDSAETSDNINYVINSGNFTTNGAFIWKTALAGATTKERLKLSSAGQLTNTVSGSNGQFILYQQQASYNTDAMSYFHNNANASTGWNFLKMFSGYPDNTQDVEFVFRGDGNAYADTGWTTPASDYAEYFESLNGEALPVGSTVVLVGNKIRVATESDTNIIGVIRPKGAALFLGNNEAQKWNGKYLKDDYGAYILDENGHRILNPNYDSEITYVSRENRVEWNVVGLIGQVPITKGQPVNSNWIKMKDISSSVEEWLIK